MRLVYPFFSLFLPELALTISADPNVNSWLQSRTLDEPCFRVAEARRAAALVAECHAECAVIDRVAGDKAAKAALEAAKKALDQPCVPLDVINGLNKPISDLGKDIDKLNDKGSDSDYWHHIYTGQ